jgi:nicotinate-nucleotide pyrophosphorylase (carboxylating)
VAANPGLRVEVEVMDLDELRAVLAAGCTEVLLDNMSTDQMREAVAINDAAGRQATLEASGGLTLDRAKDVAATGVDFISVGALTHSVDVFDLGLDFRES